MNNPRCSTDIDIRACIIALTNARTVTEGMNHFDISKKLRVVNKVTKIYLCFKWQLQQPNSPFFPASIEVSSCCIYFPNKTDEIDQEFVLCLIRRCQYFGKY